MTASRGRSTFHIDHGSVTATLDNNAQANIKIGRDVFSLKNCPDFAKYLCGGWLEEYAYIQLAPLRDDGVIRDIRIGLEVSWKPDNRRNDSQTAQEFDVILSDGKRLFVIECKGGRVVNEDFYRLQNSVRNYGGVEAKGILVASFVPPAPVRKRFSAASNLVWLADQDVETKLKKTICRLVAN